MSVIRVASRKSALAMTQTRWVVANLQTLRPELEFQIVPITTKGDKILDVTLSKVGGKGLFVSEIEQCLLEEEADFAVHSLKDVPAQLTAGLLLGGIPRRFDARDVLVSRDGHELKNLPAESVVGTSSLRRMAQIRALRPDLRVKSVRGNIDTRLRKVKEREVDAVVLAASGLIRMGWEEEVTEYLNPDAFLPAVGQGILGIECRENDNRIRALLREFTDAETESAALAERSLMAALGGSCQVPLGGYATVLKSGEIRLEGLVANPDGTQVLRAGSSGKNPREVGAAVAVKLMEQGAGEILAAAELKA